MSQKKSNPAPPKGKKPSPPPAPPPHRNIEGHPTSINITAAPWMLYCTPPKAKPVPANFFVKMIAGNVDNTGISDKDFRDFIRNTLEIVDYEE